MAKMKTNKKFIEELEDTDFIPRSEYRGSQVRVDIECKKCGHVWSVTPSNLLHSGKGCLMCWKYSQYKDNEILSEDGDILTLDTSTKKYPNSVMLIDRESYQTFRNKYKGRIFPNVKGYMAINTDSHTIPIHRLLLNPPDGLQIDHINGIRYDNRSDNLRIVTSRENCQNKDCHRAGTCSSKYVGVYKSGNLYYARITIDSKGVALGSYSKEDDAGIAYMNACNKISGTEYPLDYYKRRD